MVKVIIVNEKDEQIGLKERKDIKKNEMYRVSALWITNSKGEILLAQRAFTKKNSPGKWGPACAGTIEEGETYESNIVKEAEEELGLKNIPPKKGPKIKNDEGEHIYFCQWFILNKNLNIKDLKIQKDEVEQVGWFKKEKILKNILEHPENFTKNLHQWIKLFS